MASLFDIGKSGLNSYRQALAVTGQNIANINTDGYKRRGVDLEEISASQSGMNSVGSSPGLGVRVSEIRRAFDEFLLTKARSTTAYAEATSTFSSSIKQLEDIILPGDANVGAAIGRFFTGLQEISSMPSDLAARTVAFEQAKQMAESFNETAALIEGYRDGLMTQAQQQLDDVNVLTAELAAINLQLSTTGGAKPNNSLLDSRDAIIDKLSEYVEVTVDLNEKGVATVTLGDNPNGPRLVQMDRTTQLGAEMANDKLTFVLAPGAENILTSQVTNGSLAGIAAANSTAGDVMAEIDNMAFILVREFNAIHNRGLNLEGERSGDLFRAVDVRVLPNRNNTGSTSTELMVTDYNLVDEGKVTFTYDAGRGIWNGRDEYGELVASGRDQVTLPGVRINFLGAAADFDQFIYDPVSGSAAGLSLVIKRPQDFAAASPLLVSANPRNTGQALIEALPTNPPAPPTLPSIEEVFSNNRSAVAATGFLSGGAVAVIPANTAKLDIFSLSGQSTANFSLSPESLADIDEISLTIRSLDTDEQVVEKTVKFNVSFSDIKGFEGSWLDFNQIAKFINVGTITGVMQGSGESVSLASLGGFVSGAGGSLTFSLTKNDFSEASALISGGRTVDGAVTAGVAAESDVQIFTREGRHVAGTLQTDAGREALQAMMTEANGFNVGAVYVGDYLNQSDEDGYLGIETVAKYNSEVLISSEQAGDQTQITFSALEGIDTNESSVDGLGASAATIGYSMSVGTLSASIDDADIDGSGADDVAIAMLRELRNTAPVAMLVGLADAAPLDSDTVRLRFEDNIYTVAMTDGEPLVTGGEDGRLSAFFDAQKRLNIISTAGSIRRSEIEVVAGVGDEANVAAARRYGLMYHEQHIPTRFSGEVTSIDGTTAPDTDTVVTLSFDRNDVYNLGFVFNDKPDFGPTSTSDMAFSLNNLVVTDGDASAVASAINAAVAANATDGDGGADMTSLVSATSIGGMVTVRLKDGLGVEIQPVGGSVSTGDGEVTIGSYTDTTTTTMATAALQLDEGKHFSFVMNGHVIDVDTSPAGIRAASDGTLSGVISDAENAIVAAIESRSGPGTGSVSSSLSVTGTSLNFNISDATGSPIVISDLQSLTHNGEAQGSVIINEDLSVLGSVTVQNGDYPTSDATSSGLPLTIGAGKTGTIDFGNNQQYYSFEFDANGDGAIGTDELFVIDGVKGNFADELESVASDISTRAGSEVALTVSGSTLQISNNRSDGAGMAFGTGQPVRSPTLDPLTGGAAHFLPEQATSSDLENVTGSFEILAGTTAISTSGLDVSAADATAALQFEEGKIFTFSVNGRSIELDTTQSGLNASSGGTLADVIADAVAEIKIAIEAVSGVGNATVTSTNSLSGARVRFDLTDLTGNPIVISDLEQVQRPAIDAGSLTVMPDIDSAGGFQRRHGEFLTTDGQSGGSAIEILDGKTAAVKFSSTDQRYVFSLDVNGNGSADQDETYIVDGIKGDFLTELSAVAEQLSSHTSVTAELVDGELRVSNGAGNGSALAFGIADAVSSEALSAVTAGTAFFKSAMSADSDISQDSDTVSMLSDTTLTSADGRMAAAITAGTLTDSFTVPDFDLRREGNQIIIVPDDGADMPDVTTDAISLAKQRYTLSNLPGEDLIMIVGDAGARRLSVQYDMLPEVALQPQRDIDIRVTDIDAGEITYFDVETGTSLASRRLDEDQKATALNFNLAFTGMLAADDAFMISGNQNGTGDNRNIEQLLQLQSRDLMGTGSGGFQKVFSATVAKLGAVVQSGNIAAEAAIALRDASLEAESEYTGVNLDTEAANLIEQQQAYQASARILATARELFDTLIQSV